MRGETLQGAGIVCSAIAGFSCYSKNREWLTVQLGLALAGVTLLLAGIAIEYWG